VRAEGEHGAGHRAADPSLPAQEGPELVTRDHRLALARRQADRVPARDAQRAAVGIDNLAVGEHHAGAARVADGARQLLELGGLPDVVLVGQCDHVAGALTDDALEVARRAHPLRVDLQADRERGTAGELGHDVRGPVGRPVVADDELGGRQRLVGDALELLVEEPRSLESRQRDRHSHDETSVPGYGVRDAATGTRPPSGARARAPRRRRAA
jgi:hypothetical protein